MIHFVEWGEDREKVAGRCASGYDAALVTNKSFGMTAYHIGPYAITLARIGEATAKADRKEAAEKKRIVDAFRAGQNPYEVSQPQPAVVEKINDTKFKPGD